MAPEQRVVFGTAAESYDAFRPEYPEPLIDALATSACDGAQVLDIGCGTGKATAQLARRGLGGVGVEADPSMATVARRNLASFEGWTIEVSDFETFTTADRFALLTCAQAWHWIDPERGLAQAAELLEPRGTLALFWNRPSLSSSPIIDAMADVYATAATSRFVPPSIGRKKGGEPEVDQLHESGFADPQIRTFEWSKTYSAAEWVALSATQSDHMMLPENERTALLDRIAKVIDDHGGTYEHGYSTLLWTATRR